MAEAGSERTVEAGGDTPPNDQSRPRRKRGQGQNPRGGRPDGQGEQRSNRSRNDRNPTAGWGDGIERCICTAFFSRIPPSYPVQHRTGVATMAPVIVDRTAGRILLCDGQHEGPHVWPDGEVAPIPVPEVKEPPLA